MEDQGRNERTQFFRLGGTLVAERTRALTSESATVNYLHTDHRGTPTVKTSSAGTRTYRSRLQPYGTPYDGIYRDGPGFTKHATDEIGPTSYMQQRYFDFGMMRFIIGRKCLWSAGQSNHRPEVSMVRRAVHIGIHGVSGSAAMPNVPCSSATCGELESAGFKVQDTPTRADPDHKTIEL